MKKFFKKTEGFTLVELIVVIAILGILAGVGTVGYSGYIKKAQTAADNQLLAAVNQAYAAACIENGKDMSKMTASEATITLGAGANGGKVVASITPTDYQDAFEKYYAGNESAEFKVINSLVFDTAKKVFVDPATSDTFTVSYGGHDISISGAAVQAMQNSTFGTEMGGAALLNEVASLTNMVGTGDIDAEALLADEAYMRSFASYLGVENADTLSYVVGGGGDLNDAIDAAMEAAIANAGLTDPDEIEAAAGNAMINGMVYYAAEGSKSMTADEVTTFLTSGNIAGNMSTNQSKKLAQASMAYGMYTAFVNSDYNTVGATSSAADPMGALRTISGTGANSEAFEKYITSAEGKADIEAYMAAMDVINASTGNDVTASVLLNGFGDAELADLLTQVLGK